jgi:MFS family permease
MDFSRLNRSGISVRTESLCRRLPSEWTHRRDDAKTTPGRFMTARRIAPAQISGTIVRTLSQASQSRFFGISVVRSAFLLAIFGWGVGFYGPPVYLAAVVARTGWPLALVSTAVTAHFLIGAIVIAALPRAYACAGLPIVTTVGAVIAAMGVLGWAIAWQPWQLFIAALMSGAGWVAMGAVAVNAVVSRWYARGRPSALAKAYNGASVGGVIFSPLWVALIDTWGFPAAAAAVGMAMILVVAMMSRMVFSKAPESLGQAMDGGANVGMDSERPGREAIRLPKASLWRDRAFITLAAGMALGLFAQIGLLAHLFKLLTPVLGAQFAGLLMGCGTACAILGRMVAARMVGRVGDRRIVAAAGYVVQALGVAVLLVADADQTWLIALGVALFGSGIGNASSLPPLVAQADFAAKDVPRVVALIVAIAQGTYAFAPAVFGLLQSGGGAGQALGIGQHTALFFLVAIAVQAVAALTFLAGRRGARFERAVY